jgi:cell division protease FtsH
MIARYGISERLGARQVRGAAAGAVPPGPGRREYSEETGRLIDEELRQMLEAAHARVQQTLEAKRGALEALAKLLMEKEVVDRAALAELLNPARAA